MGAGVGGGVCGMGQRWETKRMTKTDQDQEAVSEMETEMKWCNVTSLIENWRVALLLMESEVKKEREKDWKKGEKEKKKACLKGILPSSSV